MREVGERVAEGTGGEVCCCEGAGIGCWGGEDGAAAEGVEGFGVVAHLFFPALLGLDFFYLWEKDEEVVDVVVVVVWKTCVLCLCAV